nr:immunoglobulin heavy chain junction region [Mus musculus]MBK4196647.1 immunoglobulin heavy chain junction region [Mus musculus]
CTRGGVTTVGYYAMDFW